MFRKMAIIAGVSIVLSGATAPTVNAVFEIDIEQQKITDQYKTGFIDNSRIVRVINNKTNDVEIGDYYGEYVTPVSF